MYCSEGVPGVHVLLLHCLCAVCQETGEHGPCQVPAVPEATLTQKSFTQLRG